MELTRLEEEEIVAEEPCAPLERALLEDNRVADDWPALLLLDDGVMTTAFGEQPTKGMVANSTHKILGKYFVMTASHFLLISHRIEEQCGDILQKTLSNRRLEI